MDTEKFGTTKIITAVTAIIVLALILIGVNYLNKKQVAKAPSQQDETRLLGQPEQAPTGKTAEGFPQALFLQGNKLVSSYTIPYPASKDSTKIVHQYSINATTSLSITQEFNTYLSVMQNKGFTILSQSLDLTKDKMGRILAEDSKGTATVTIYNDVTTGKTTVTASYLEK